MASESELNDSEYTKEQVLLNELARIKPDPARRSASIQRARNALQQQSAAPVLAQRRNKWIWRIAAASAACLVLGFAVVFELIHSIQSGREPTLEEQLERLNSRVGDSPESAAAEWRDPELKTGVGIGPLKLGATKVEAIAIFGEPEVSADRAMHYYSHGCSIRLDGNGRVNAIECYLRPADKLSAGDFKGHLGEIRLGAARAAVEKIFGPADAGSSVLAYPSRGVIFTMESDRLIRIEIAPPH